MVLGGNENTGTPPALSDHVLPGRLVDLERGERHVVLAARRRAALPRSSPQALVVVDAAFRATGSTSATAAVTIAEPAPWPVTSPTRIEVAVAPRLVPPPVTTALRRPAGRSLRAGSAPCDRGLGREEALLHRAGQLHLALELGEPVAACGSLSRFRWRRRTDDDDREHDQAVDRVRPPRRQGGGLTWIASRMPASFHTPCALEPWISSV